MRLCGKINKIVSTDKLDSNLKRQELQVKLTGFALDIFKIKHFKIKNRKVLIQRIVKDNYEYFKGDSIILSIDESKSITMPFRVEPNIFCSNKIKLFCEQGIDSERKITCNSNGVSQEIKIPSNKTFIDLPDTLLNKLSKFDGKVVKFTRGKEATSLLIPTNKVSHSYKFDTNYDGWDEVVMENPHLRLTLSDRLNGRILSVFNKNNNFNYFKCKDFYSKNGFYQYGGIYEYAGRRLIEGVKWNKKFKIITMNSNSVTFISEKGNPKIIKFIKLFRDLPVILYQMRFINKGIGKCKINFRNYIPFAVENENDNVFFELFLNNKRVRFNYGFVLHPWLRPYRKYYYPDGSKFSIVNRTRNASLTGLFPENTLSGIIIDSSQDTFNISPFYNEVELKKKQTLIRKILFIAGEKVFHQKDQFALRNGDCVIFSDGFKHKYKKPYKKLSIPGFKTLNVIKANDKVRLSLGKTSKLI